MYLHCTALLQTGQRPKPVRTAQIKAEESTVIQPGDGLKELSGPVRPFAEVWPRRNRLVDVKPS
eukprot:7250255-Pyramimonas_sp.AAC.1